MIDLNNTWCEATEETEKYLYKNVSKNTHNLNKENIFIIEKVHNKLDVKTINYIPNSNYKQIHLVNGEFQYVEPKPKNNFKDYGFEADFEGEILKETIDVYNKRKIYIGYYIGDNDVKYPCIWDLFGECDFCCSVKYHERNLKPIKKEWYLNKDNFEAYKGKIIINKYGNIRMIQSIDENKVSTFEQNMYHDIIRVEEWRPATKEEVLSLLVKA